MARVHAAGGRLIVMPHADLAVIRAAKAQGMVCVPGVATPTEAFAALAAGADGFKMFPAEALPPAALKAWRAVLPAGTLVFAVGGMKPDNMAPYWAAGASGFGTGSNLYKPGVTQRASCAKWRRPTRLRCTLPARPSSHRTPPARPEAALSETARRESTRPVPRQAGVRNAGSTGRLHTAAPSATQRGEARWQRRIRHGRPARR